MKPSRGAWRSACATCVADRYAYSREATPHEIFVWLAQTPGVVAAWEAFPAASAAGADAESPLMRLRAKSRLSSFALAQLPLSSRTPQRP